ncbi:hypothetical protein D3C83_241380 [compost metagenome]
MLQHLDIAFRAIKPLHMFEHPLVLDARRWLDELVEEELHQLEMCIRPGLAEVGQGAEIPQPAHMGG